ncbi:hypothetical protein Y1Q_0007557 [Alligator mississippiensis]|uniref:Uncharacterized protein n=1 Tax=Alligator mississippiensis TaxID=8496 RepID=A0A151M5F2_ALLMI|nr:hypothetical protein Y1Q_0007557 [Alligator mississippiensis]
MAAVAGATGPGRLWLCLLAALQALSVYGTKFVAKRKLSLKLESYMQGLFSKCVDENWEGSLKSRLLSGVTSPNCSGDCKSSMCVVLTLY